MGIKDRDYMRDWRPPEDWEPEPEAKPPARRWTLNRIMACIAAVLFVACLVLIAVFKK